MDIAKNNDKPLSFDISKSTGIEKILESKDTLQTKMYSRALFEFIQECDTPMTVGIQGDWGIGKTSMMNMMRAWLQAENNTSRSADYGIIWFNTWQFSLFGGDEYLGVAALSELMKTIRDTFEIQEEQDNWKNVKKLASSLSISVMGVSIDGKKMTSEEGSDYEDLSKVMKEFKKEFNLLVEHIIKTSNLERLIFFVDDLDRVKPLKALELLESLKNFLDVENCVFVLAVDYEVVQMGMKQKFGVDLQKQSGKSFFDKIIQLPFTMPSASYDLKNYLTELTANIEGFRGKIPEFGDVITEVTRLTVGSNPRSIKRVVNYIRLIVKLNRQDSNWRNLATFNKDEVPILYSIVCMQVAWPEIFNFFLARPTPDRIRQIEDWEYLDQIPNIQKLYDRTPNVDQLKSRISGFFDLFFDLIDTSEKDGIITKEEFEPVLKVLKRVRYLSDHQLVNEPIEDLLKLVQDNGGSKEASFLEEVYRKSSWHTSNEVELKVSGKRYCTLVYNRRQIGSLVTMKTEKLLFRLQLEADGIRDALEAAGIENVDALVYPLDDLSKSGFGKTVVDIRMLLNMDRPKAVQILERVYSCLNQQKK